VRVAARREKCPDFAGRAADRESGTGVAFGKIENAKEHTVETQSLILALNETRKTLLASRLLVARASERGSAALGGDIRPGDGIWVEACNSIDTSGMQAPVDVVFLDSDGRVVGTVSNVRPGKEFPVVEGAAGVLELAAGTIRLTHTQKGDQVVLEPIASQTTAEAPLARASRS